MWGYQNMLAVLSDPSDEEHASMLEWVGGGFDPEAFDPSEFAYNLEARLRARAVASRFYGPSLAACSSASSASSGSGLARRRLPGRNQLEHDLSRAGQLIPDQHLPRSVVAAEDQAAWWVWLITATTFTAGGAERESALEDQSAEIRR